MSSNYGEDNKSSEDVSQKSGDSKEESKIEIEITGPPAPSLDDKENAIPEAPPLNEISSGGVPDAPPLEPSNQAVDQVKKKEKEQKEESSIPAKSAVESKREARAPNPKHSADHLAAIQKGRGQLRPVVPDKSSKEQKNDAPQKWFVDVIGKRRKKIDDEDLDKEDVILGKGNGEQDKTPIPSRTTASATSATEVITKKPQTSPKAATVAEAMHAKISAKSAAPSKGQEDHLAAIRQGGAKLRKVEPKVENKAQQDGVQPKKVVSGDLNAALSAIGAKKTGIADKVAQAAARAQSDAAKNKDNDEWDDEPKAPASKAPAAVVEKPTANVVPVVDKPTTAQVQVQQPKQSTFQTTFVEPEDNSPVAIARRERKEQESKAERNATAAAASAKNVGPQDPSIKEFEAMADTYTKLPNQQELVEADKKEALEIASSRNQPAIPETKIRESIPSSQKNNQSSQFNPSDIFTYSVNVSTADVPKSGAAKTSTAGQTAPEIQTEAEKPAKAATGDNAAQAKIPSQKAVEPDPFLPVDHPSAAKPTQIFPAPQQISQAQSQAQPAVESKDDTQPKTSGQPTTGSPQTTASQTVATVQPSTILAAQQNPQPKTQQKTPSQQPLQPPAQPQAKSSQQQQKQQQVQQPSAQSPHTLAQSLADTLASSKKLSAAPSTVAANPAAQKQGVQPTAVLTSFKATTKGKLNLMDETDWLQHKQNEKDRVNSYNTENSTALIGKKWDVDTTTNKNLIKMTLPSGGKNENPQTVEVKRIIEEKQSEDGKPGVKTGRISIKTGGSPGDEALKMSVQTTVATALAQTHNPTITIKNVTEAQKKQMIEYFNEALNAENASMTIKFQTPEGQTIIEKLPIPTTPKEETKSEADTGPSVKLR